MQQHQAHPHSRAGKGTHLVKREPLCWVHDKQLGDHVLGVRADCRPHIIIEVKLALPAWHKICSLSAIARRRHVLAHAYCARQT